MEVLQSRSAEEQGCKDVGVGIQKEENEEGQPFWSHPGPNSFSASALMKKIG